MQPKGLRYLRVVKGPGQEWQSTHLGLQDSASLATRVEGLEKEMEALKEAHGLETDRMTAELARTHEVRCRLHTEGIPSPCCLHQTCSSIWGTCDLGAQLPAYILCRLNGTGCS